MNTGQQVDILKGYFEQAMVDCGYRPVMIGLVLDRDESPGAVFGYKIPGSPHDWWALMHGEQWYSPAPQLSVFSRLLTTEHPIPANYKTWLARYRKGDETEPGMERWLRLEHRGDLNTYRRSLCSFRDSVQNSRARSRSRAAMELEWMEGWSEIRKSILNLPPVAPDMSSIRKGTTPHPGGPEETPEEARTRTRRELRRARENAPQQRRSRSASSSISGGLPLRASFDRWRDAVRADLREMVAEDQLVRLASERQSLLVCDFSGHPDGEYRRRMGFVASVEEEIIELRDMAAQDEWEDAELDEETQPRPRDPSWAIRTLDGPILGPQSRSPFDVWEENIGGNLVGRTRIEAATFLNEEANRIRSIPAGLEDTREVSRRLNALVRMRMRIDESWVAGLPPVNSEPSAEVWVDNVRMAVESATLNVESFPLVVRDRGLPEGAQAAFLPINATNGDFLAAITHEVNAAMGTENKMRVLCHWNDWVSGSAHCRDLSQTREWIRIVDDMSEQVGLELIARIAGSDAVNRDALTSWTRSLDEDRHSGV